MELITTHDVLYCLFWSVSFCENAENLLQICYDKHVTCQRVVQFTAFVLFCIATEQKHKHSHKGNKKKVVAHRVGGWVGGWVGGQMGARRCKFRFVFSGWCMLGCLGVFASKTLCNYMVQR